MSLPDKAKLDKAKLDKMQPPPRRVRITHPRVDQVRQRPARAVTSEIDEQTDLGGVYVRALVRGQLRLALVVCTVALAGLAGIAVLFAASPQLAAYRLLGVPLCWLVLGVLLYPGLIGLAAYTVRHAERNESDFLALLRRRG